MAEEDRPPRGTLFFGGSHWACLKSRPHQKYDLYIYNDVCQYQDAHGSWAHRPDLTSEQNTIYIERTDFSRLPSGLWQFPCAPETFVETKVMEIVTAAPKRDYGAAECGAVGGSDQNEAPPQDPDIVAIRTAIYERVPNAQFYTAADLCEAAARSSAARAGISHIAISHTWHGMPSSSEGDCARAAQNIVDFIDFGEFTHVFVYVYRNMPSEAGPAFIVECNGW